MKSVYIINNSEIRSLRKKCKQLNRITLQIRSYGKKENGKALATFETIKNGKEDAHALAAARAFIDDPKHVIYDEGNLYYTKSLFDLLSEIEQKFRGVLRLRMILSKDKVAISALENLENEDFGTYCINFFGDKSFTEKAKKIINDERRSFHEQNYAISLLQEIETECLWDRHFAENELKSIRHEHHSIRRIRNSTMHNHLIQKAYYLQGRRLLEKTRNELDAFIENLFAESPSDSTSFAKDYSLLLQEVSESILEAANLYTPSSSLAEALLSCASAASVLSALQESSFSKLAFKEYLDSASDLIDAKKPDSSENDDA